MPDIGVLPVWLREDYEGRKCWATPKGEWEPCDASSHRECRAAMGRLDAAEAAWATAALFGSFVLGDLRVMVSVAVKRKQGSWLHVSYSYKDRIPDHDDTLTVRQFFLRPHLPCVSIWPRESEYVNEMPYCLHLWQRLDEPCVPDMRTSAGRI